MKKSLLLVLLVLLVLSCTQKQPLADIPIPLKEHPRPDFERSVWQNLNGYWKFAPDSAMVGEKQGWQQKRESFTSKILVPFSWASPLSEIILPKVNV